MRLMTETRAGDLEATLADVGTLLVRLEKYRLEAHPEAKGLPSKGDAAPASGSNGFQDKPRSLEAHADPAMVRA
jgi:hypothetical protein